MAELPPAVQNLILHQLHRCRQLKDLPVTQRLHAYMQQHALESHRVLGNHLVPTLVACGSLPDAQHAFDRLPYHTEHSWSSLISGYIESGAPHHAFHLYHRMQQELVQPSIYTLQALLKACARLKDVEKGRRLHARIVTEGFEGDPFVGNTLVDMYGKCCSLAEARHVFDGLPGRDTVSWNVLIAGYAEHGCGQEALNCFDEMQQEDMPLGDSLLYRNSYRFMALMKACITLSNVERGRGIHTEIIKKGMEGYHFIGNALVDMYGKCGSVLEACQVFNKLVIRDAISWNALTTAYAKHGLDEEVLGCFEQMQLDGHSPDSVMFAYSLKACSSTKTTEMGEKLCTETAKKGLERDPFVGGALVDMYVKCGLLEEAHVIFNQLPVRNVVLWNTLLGGYADDGRSEEVPSCLEQMRLEGISPDDVTFACSVKACSNIGGINRGQDIHTEVIKLGIETELYVGTALVGMYATCSLLTEAQQVFDRLPVRNTVTWAALMSGYEDHGCDDKVLDHFKQMQRDGVPANSLSIIRCLQACGTMGALETGREIHDEIRRLRLERDLLVANMLVDMYCKCSSLAEGREVFDSMPIKDVVTWNAMIKGYGDNDEGVLAVQCFQEMQEQGVKPNTITFTCLLAACSHANLVQEGHEYFKMMTEEYGLEPTLDHITSMVDLLARSGNIDKATRLAEETQCLSSGEILRALLTACKMYGEVELGLRCFQQLVQVSEDDAAAYMMMAEIYRNAGRFCDANALEEMRTDSGTKKIPASASIELNKKLHEFVIGNHQHKDIIAVVETLSSHIRDQSYVPNVDLILRRILDEDKNSTLGQLSGQSCVLTTF